MSMTIDQLQIEIQARSTSAASSIDALSSSLTQLRSAVKGGAGLTTATKQFQAFSQAIQTMQAPTQKIAELVGALNQLEKIGKSNLGSALNQLKKIPEITANLDEAKLAAFAAKIVQVTDAVRPLAVEMEKVSAGFSKLPANIQRAINANAKLTASNYKAQGSFFKLANVMAKVYVIKRIANVIGGLIKESNDYVENLNLFTVAMGEYAASAKEYAEHVGELLGIDPSAWMRNQGIFMTLATGFGVATDKAALMSKNLTQLGYDLSSFFNISVEDAMQKLQSGLSGELEPLRRLGYDLSQAKLQAIALSLGIKKSINAMNQAEKSQLRYYAIMTQVTTAQGDMARTLEAPANQLRILKAEVTQAARALGNVFIPALNAVLPYAIAFLKVVRTIANEISNLFGFSLPEMDYSGVQAIGEDAETANESVKELKNTLLGFDELNILNTSANGILATSGNVLDFTLPEYDFLGDLINNKSDELAKKLEEPFKNALKIVALIGAGMLAWKIATGVMDFMTTLEKFGKGGTIALGLTISLIGFTISAEGFQAIGYGNAQLMDIVKAAIGSALGIAGSLIVFGTGPVGWIIGITAAVTIAISNIIIGQDKAISDMVSDAFYADTQGAIAIKDLADSYAALMNAVIEANEPIIENGGIISNAMETNVRPAIDDINAISAAIDNGAYTAAQKIPELVAAFEQLKTGTQTILDTVYENIVRAVSGSLYQSLADAGQYVPELLGILASIKGEVDVTFDSITESFQQAKTAFDEGKISPEEYAKTIYGLTDEMQNLVGKTDPVAEAFSNVSRALDGINWGNKDAKNTAFSVISQSAADAKTSVEASFKSIEDSIKIARGWSDDPSYQLALDKIMLGAEDTRTKQLNSIKTTIDGFYNQVQTSLINKASEVAKVAADEWESKSPIGKLWSGDKASYVERAIGNYRRDIVDPISNEIESSMKQLGIDGSAWASDSMKSIVDALFGYYSSKNGKFPNHTDANKLQSDLENQIKTVLGNIKTNLNSPAKDAGSSVIAGLKDGITGGKESVNKAIKGVADEGLNTYKDKMGIRSPSTVMFDQGKYTVQGLANGITQNTFEVKNAFESMLNKISESFNVWSSNLISGFNTMIGEIVKSANSVKITGTGTSSFSNATPPRISYFSEGGFPTSGQLFFANENGPEFVGTMGSRTAVANNDQIVEGVASGVASANAEQNALLREQNKLLRQLIEQDKTIIFPTSAEAGRAVSRSIGMYDKARGAV